MTVDKKEKVKYGDIEVTYKASLNGGGTTFGQEFVGVVQDKIGKVGHIYEFCSGPGFIGFSLMAAGLCDRLTLADINPAAVEICKETVANNGLTDRVSVYQSDCLNDIPESEKWDLVVSNPPHWPEYDDIHGTDIRRFDIDLKIHDRFYNDIGKFMNPGGQILMQENCQATVADDFGAMIKANGLEVVDEFKADPQSHFYFLLINALKEVGK